VARLIGGRLSGGSGAGPGGGTEIGGTPATGAAIDSRAVREGDIFFAIRGERDGLDYASAALAAGAVAAVVPRGGSSRVGGPSIEVEEPREALGRLAAAVRREERDSLPAVAVTGSVGKTTLCGYLAEILSPLGPTHRPPASFNNDLGVPLTILGAPERTRVLIIEIGTNAPGEVSSLAAWTEAKVGVVTAIAPAHLSGLGSLAGIAREKLSLLDALQSDSVGWVPVEHAAAARAHGRPVRSFGEGGDSEVAVSDGDPARARWLGLGGGRTFLSAARRRHQRRLLAAALGVGSTLGADPEAMLARVPLLVDPPLRGEVRRHGGVELVLDCYNASPAALEAAIEALEEEPAAGRRLCVLGTMEELGAEEESWHREVGRRLGRSAIDGVFVVGRAREWYRDGLRELGRDGEAVDADDRGARRIAEALRPGDRVLFKASRREALEALAARIAAHLGAEERR